MTEDYEMRREALAQAFTDHATDSAEYLVKRAQAFYEFLKGEQAEPVKPLTGDRAEVGEIGNPCVMSTANREACGKSAAFRVIGDRDTDVCDGHLPAAVRWHTTVISGHPTVAPIR